MRRFTLLISVVVLSGCGLVLPADPTPHALGTALRDGQLHVYLPDCGEAQVDRIYVEKTVKESDGNEVASTIWTGVGPNEPSANEFQLTSDQFSDASGSQADFDQTNLTVTVETSNGIYIDGWYGSAPTALGDDEVLIDDAVVATAELTNGERWC